jgi:hypothetical protein
MNKKIIIPMLCTILFLILSSLASAVIFDVAAAREKEWERYEAYKADYLKANDLEAYADYIYEPNLIRNFGFRGPDYYYIPPNVLQAKYNPPLQGDVYSTFNRGYTSSLYQPSAVKYFGDQVNGRYAGYIPSNLGGTYFDHPYANQASGYLTINDPNYGSYGYSGYGNYGYGDYANYGGYGSYGYSGYDYGYSSFQGSDYYINDAYSKEPAYYARIAEPLSGGFYVVGFY